MDYWSVLEYELYYKKRDNAEIEAELKKYAEEIANLDHRMLGLRNKIEKIWAISECEIRMPVLWQTCKITVSEKENIPVLEK